MVNRCKVTTNIFLTGLTIGLLFFITLPINAKNRIQPDFRNSLTARADSLQPGDTVSTVLPTDSIPGDSTGLSPDSLLRKPAFDTLTISSDSLSSPVEYSADDSGVLFIPQKQFFLYGNAATSNKDIKLEAATIKYDQQTQLVTAYGGTDTLNNPLSKPKITQAGSTSISDTIFFNMENQKGISKNTFYNEGEIFVNAEKVKKINKDIAYAYRARFTTCNLDTPHFDIRARKIELINNKLAISGPAFPEFEGVPIPIPIPFGIYPLNQGRHSGILAPAFATNDSYGLGLEGLGYYKVLSDYWDVTVKSNLYSYGGWTLDINPKYYKRYKYRGNFDLSIQHTKLLNQNALTPNEFNTTNSFFITWSHSMDSKARPGTSFSASVHAGTTSFNQYVPNDAFRNYNNNLSSSITYNKNWGDGRYNLSIAADQNQNSIGHTQQIQLPTLNFTATTIYPFQKKNEVGTPKWYEKLGISYNGTILNQFAFYDTSKFSFKHILDTLQWGAEHTIPITLALPKLGPVLIAPSVSYSERWYGQEILKNWNQSEGKVDTTLKKGFYTAREVSFSLSFNTKIFGTYNFHHPTGIQAIRHQISPFVSISYKPDLVSQYYQNVQVDSNATHIARVSKFAGGIIGSYAEGRFGGVNFGIDNLLQMKVKKSTDTTEAPKKVNLIDGLSITSGYNFFAPGDTLNWSPFLMTFRSTLFDKINITGGATVDPYATDSFGNRINHLLWKDGKIGRFTTGNLAISTSLKSKPRDNRSDSARMPVDETLTPDEQQRELDYVRQNPADFVDFNIPWSLQLSYSLNLARMPNPNYHGFTTLISSSINVNGDFSLTPKWKIGGGTYFDFRSGKISTFNMFITREMHCWQMAINIQVGSFKSFSITLNPKSGILRDLKINRARSFTNN